MSNTRKILAEHKSDAKSLLSASENAIKKHALPSLIFFERSHDDPTTRAIITALLPKLKALGYTLYYAEMPMGIKMDDYFKKKFAIRDGDLSLVNALKSNHIKYKNIDLQLIMNLVKGKDHPLNEMPHEIRDVLLPVRDQLLSHPYLTSTENVLGKVGMGHAPGIQNEILKYISKEEAMDNFCFFDCYSCCDDNDQFVKTPLGVTSIEVSPYSDDNAILNSILKTITEKQKKLNKDKIAFIEEKEIKIDYTSEAKKAIAQCLPTMNFAEHSIYKKVIQTVIEEADSEKMQFIIDARVDLLDYIAKRTFEREGHLYHSHPDFLTFFGQLAGMSGAVKLSAANKLIDILKGSELSTISFSDREVMALTQGRLGTIVARIKDKLNLKLTENAIRYSCNH